MKLDRFINRPVLSTVISILIVILGAIGLATLPITQYPDIDRIEFRDCSIGGTDQRCRKHDVYDLNCVKHRFR